jgi:hypothetical protein
MIKEARNTLRYFALHSISLDVDAAYLDTFSMYLSMSYDW